MPGEIYEYMTDWYNMAMEEDERRQWENLCPNCGEDKPWMVWQDMHKPCPVCGVENKDVDLYGLKFEKLYWRDTPATATRPAYREALLTNWLVVDEDEARAIGLRVTIRKYAQNYNIAYSKLGSDPFKLWLKVPHAELERDFKSIMHRLFHELDRMLWSANRSHAKRIKGHNLALDK